MTRLRRSGWRGALLSSLLASAACERAKDVPSNDTAVPAPSPPETTATPPPPPLPAAWDSAAGPALIVAGPTPAEAFVIFPAYTDSTMLDTAHFELGTVRGSRIDLFARGRLAGKARLTSAVAAASDTCTSWPSARIVSLDGSSPIPAWTVAFAGTRAAAIAVDSIEGLAPADSAKLAVEVTRLASALPNDTAPAFRGLPFVVRSVRRFRVDDADVLVAEAVRKVNLEANPRQEQVLIIAERDSGMTTPRYEAAYIERVSGPEETIEATDVLAVVVLGANRRPTIILGRDYGDGVSYTLLERDGRKRWRARWSSAYAGC